MQFNLAPHTTSKPIQVPAGTIVSVTPATGASVLVEYTSDTAANIMSGAATWAAWPNGLVTAAAQDTLASQTTVRITTNGGMVYVDLNDNPNSSSGGSGGIGGASVQLSYDPYGYAIGAIGKNNRVTPLGVNDWVESQWTRALLVAPPPRQINAVKDLSAWANDGHYLGSAVDADIYDSLAAYTPVSGAKPSGNWIGTGWTNTGGSQTVVGTLSSTAVTSKGLMLHNSKTQWDLDAGQSLLIQHRFFIPDTGASATTPTAGIQATTSLFGSNNSSLTVQGLNVTVSAAGGLSVNLRAGAVTPTNQSSTYNVVPLVANTVYCLTIHFDGALKLLNVWINGQQKDSSTNISITGDTTASPVNYSTINPSNGGSHMGVGCAMTDAMTVTNAQRLFTSHFRMTVLPAGLQVANPGLVDYLFNRNPDRFMSDALLVGAY